MLHQQWVFGYMWFLWEILWVNSRVSLLWKAVLLSLLSRPLGSRRPFIAAPWASKDSLSAVHFRSCCFPRRRRVTAC